MRYKEFVTVEAIDRFMSTILGTNTSSSFNLPTDTTSSTDTDNKDKQSVASSGEILPVKGPITSPFGPRSRGMHLGTDFGVPVGTPVMSPQDGTVTRTGSDSMNGIFVEIQSGSTVHLLLHLSKSKVSSGDQVKQGQVVALSGNTGHSTGPHLHWSKRIAGQPVDPMANVG